MCNSTIKDLAGERLKGRRGLDMAGSESLRDGLRAQKGTIMHSWLWANGSISNRSPPVPLDRVPRSVQIYPRSFWVHDRFRIYVVGRLAASTPQPSGRISFPKLSMCAQEAAPDGELVRLEAISQAGWTDGLDFPIP